jgi:hypothetical protein
MRALPATTLTLTFQHCNKLLEIHISLFYEFKRQIELSNGVAGRRVLLQYNKRPSVFQMDGADAIVLFGINRSGALGKGI